MSLISVDYGDVGGVTINPTLYDHDTKTRTGTTMKTFTIDTSKSYVLVMTYRYTSDTVYRTNVYSVVNGTLADLTNSSDKTGLTASLSGTTLSVVGSGVTSVPCDLSLIQLD